MNGPADPYKKNDHIGPYGNGVSPEWATKADGSDPTSSIEQLKFMENAIEQIKDLRKKVDFLEEDRNSSGLPLRHRKEVEDLEDQVLELESKLDAEMLADCATVIMICRMAFALGFDVWVWEDKRQPVDSAWRGAVTISLPDEEISWNIHSQFAASAEKYLTVDKDRKGPPATIDKSKVLTEGKLDRSLRDFTAPAKTIVDMFEKNMAGGSGAAQTAREVHRLKDALKKIGMVNE